MQCSAAIVCMVRVCSEKVGKDIILGEYAGLNLPVLSIVKITKNFTIEISMMNT